MPVYTFYHGKHQTERMAPMEAIPKRVKCSVCKRGWAKLGMSLLADQFVRGRAMNDKTKKQFRYVFGKKKYLRNETTRDIDAAFEDFHRRYPHLSPPGASRRDPDPGVRITEGYDTHRE